MMKPGRIFWQAGEKMKDAAKYMAPLLGLAALVLPMQAATAGSMIHKTAAVAGSTQNQRGGYSSGEIIAEGHKFFGKTTKGLARAVESVFARNGRPTGYILGQEASGAFIGGLRYGEGTLYMKNGQRRKVFWQGPSLGFDAGGNGSRVLMLVYNIDTAREIYDRFYGISGSAYLIGGLGVSYNSNQKVTVAPIRTGVGARLGANVGYLKMTSRPTWNPF